MKPQDVLEYVSGPMPVPAEGEVLIRMKAAPINPADINFVQGVYGVKPVLPYSRAGLEGCGVVQESRAEGFRKDDEATRNKVNDVIAEMKKDGKAAEIAQKWFGADVIKH